MSFYYVGTSMYTSGLLKYRIVYTYQWFLSELSVWNWHKSITNGTCFISRVAKLPGKSAKIREFENWPKGQKTWKLTKKSGNFIKLTDWQSSIERTSRQCWKQNMRNSNLESSGWPADLEFLETWKSQGIL